MKKIYFILIIIIIILIIIVTKHIAHYSEENTENEINISLKTVPDENTNEINQQNELKLAFSSIVSPSLTLHYYEELISYIKNELHTPIKIVNRNTYSEVNNLLKLSKLDIAFVCSGAYVQGEKEFNMELLVVPVVNNETYYYSYIIVNSNSAIKTLSDLKNKTFAFTDPLSNTGCLSPTYLLQNELNCSPNEFFSNILFTYSHDDSILAVSIGKVDGAAVDSLVYDYLKISNPKMISKTKVILKSEKYGIPPIVVRTNLNSEIKNKLRKIFLEMDKNPNGKKLLKKLNIDKFSLIKDEQYNSIRKMVEFKNKKQ